MPASISTPPATGLTAPTGVPKTGAGLDLAIAVGVLVAGDVLKPDRIEGLAFLGELGLDGSVRPVLGAVPLVGALGEREVVVAAANARDAAIVASSPVRAVAHLNDVVGALREGLPWPDAPPAAVEPPAASVSSRPW